MGLVCFFLQLQCLFQVLEQIEVGLGGCVEQRSLCRFQRFVGVVCFFCRCICWQVVVVQAFIFYFRVKLFLFKLFMLKVVRQLFCYFKNINFFVGYLIIKFQLNLSCSLFIQVIIYDLSCFLKYSCYFFDWCLFRFDSEMFSE